MPNAWILHVKQYASQNNLKYKDALKDPECRASYKTGGGPVHASRVTPEVRTPVRHPLRNVWVDPATGRRMNQIAPAQATPIETRGATPVQRNGRGVNVKNMTRYGIPKPANQPIANMTRYGKPGTFTQEDVARINRVSY